MRSTLLYLTALAILAGCAGMPEDPEITGEELFQHLSYLASDSLKGRLPGTPEDELAARYIASEFKKAGLSFLTKGGLQPFEVIIDLEKGENNSLRYMGMDYIVDEDFAPFPFSANTFLESEVVFAGYGFEMDRAELKWNDYAGMDVAGKWVMVLRGNPEIDSSVSAFHEFSNERDKAMVAGDLGAGGILFVSGPAFDAGEQLISLGKREGKVTIPAIHQQGGSGPLAGRNRHHS